MPVNMDPRKKRMDLYRQEVDGTSGAKTGEEELGKETDRDREHALADAEWKNLWDATEVIDMDNW